MPKVKLSETAEANKKIVKAIKCGMAMQDVSREQLAKAMRENRITLYRRLKNPGEFTLDELRAISAKIHIPLESIINGKTE